MKNTPGNEEGAGTLEVICPDCDALITVDQGTGVVLSHRKAPGSGKKKVSLDDLAKDLKKGKEMASKKFNKAVEERNHHSEIMEKKFREAQKRAAEEKDTGRPLRPFDLD